jgi:DNA repair protein RecO
VSIVFYQKEDRQMQYLSQASILQPFMKLREQLGRISLAGIPCEIIEKSEIERQAHPQQFQLLLDTLLALETQTTGLRNIVRAFIVQFISGAGFAPELTHCHFCLRPEADAVNYFLLRDGFYSCQSCGHYQQDGRRISGYALQLLRWFSSVPVASAAQVQADKTTGDALDSILFDYLISHIESLEALKSFAHLQKLQAKLIKSVSFN